MTTNPARMAEKVGSAVAWETRSAAETHALGKAVGESCTGHEVMALVGPLGAGKTCLVRGIAEGLGVPTDLVASPTFVLIHEYASPPSGREDVYSLAGPPRLRAHEHLPVHQRPSLDRALPAHRGHRGPSRNGLAGHAASVAALDQGHPEGLCARRVQYWREPGEGCGGRDRAPCPPAHRAAVERGHELHAAPRGDSCPAAAPKGFLHALEGGVRLRPLGGAASFAAGADVAPRPAEMTADDPPNPRGRPHRAVDHLLLPEPPRRSGLALLRRDHAADAHL